MTKKTSPKKPAKAEPVEEKVIEEITPVKEEASEPEVKVEPVAEEINNDGAAPAPRRFTPVEAPKRPERDRGRRGRARLSVVVCRPSASRPLGSGAVPAHGRAPRVGRA